MQHSLLLQGLKARFNPREHGLETALEALRGALCDTLFCASFQGSSGMGGVTVGGMGDAAAQALVQQEHWWSQTSVAPGLTLTLQRSVYALRGGGRGDKADAALLVRLLTRPALHPPVGPLQRHLPPALGGGCEAYKPRHPSTATQPGTLLTAFPITEHQIPPRDMEVRKFLNALFGLPCASQALLYALFDTFTTDTLRKMRAAGEIDEGILDLCCMLEWSEEPPVLHAALRAIAHHPQVAPDALTESGSLDVNRGLSFAAAVALHTFAIAHARAVLTYQVALEQWRARLRACSSAARRMGSLLRQCCRLSCRRGLGACGSPLGRRWTWSMRRMMRGRGWMRMRSRQLGRRRRRWR